MGMIAKSKTRQRVAPVTGQLHRSLAGTPWMTTAAATMAAAVRAAVFSTDLAGTSSTTIRGRQNALAMAVASTLTAATSKLWVETTDFKTWTFTLGTAGANDELAADWHVQLALSGTTAVVTTTHYLTNDDALVNGDQHDVLRGALLKAVETAADESEGLDLDVSAASLARAQRFTSKPPAPFDVTFAFITNVDRATGRKRLLHHGQRVLHEDDRSLRWGLGLPQHDANDHVTLTWEDGRVAAHAQVRSSSPVSRRIAHTALGNLVDRTKWLLEGGPSNGGSGGSGGSSVRYVGPDEWKPTA